MFFQKYMCHKPNTFKAMCRRACVCILSAKINYQNSKLLEEVTITLRHVRVSLSHTHSYALHFRKQKSKWGGSNCNTHHEQTINIHMFMIINDYGHTIHISIDIHKIDILGHFYNHKQLLVHVPILQIVPRVLNRALATWVALGSLSFRRDNRFTPHVTSMQRRLCVLQKHSAPQRSSDEQILAVTTTGHEWAFLLTHNTSACKTAGL